MLWRKWNNLTNTWRLIFGFLSVVSIYSKTYMCGCWHRLITEYWILRTRNVICSTNTISLSVTLHTFHIYFTTEWDWIDEARCSWKGNWWSLGWSNNVDWNDQLRDVDRHSAVICGEISGGWRLVVVVSKDDIHWWVGSRVDSLWVTIPRQNEVMYDDESSRKIEVTRYCCAVLACGESVVEVFLRGDVHWRVCSRVDRLCITIPRQVAE